MPLPKHTNKHEYSYTLPSGAKVKFRPWIVREEQEYMYATEGMDDENEKMDHIEEFIGKCIIDNTQIVGLSETDFLALCLEIRKKSKGEKHDIVFKCPHCKRKNDDEVSINLNKDIKVRSFDTSPMEIGDFEITFQDISRHELKKINDLDGKGKRSVAYLAAALKAVSTPEQTYSKFSDDEAIEFFVTMDPILFKKLSTDFAAKIPLFSIHKTLKCQHCEMKTLVYVDNVSDFFV